MKSGKFDSRSSKTPELIAHRKCAWMIRSGRSIPFRKISSLCTTILFCLPNMRKCASIDSPFLWGGGALSTSYSQDETPVPYWGLVLAVGRRQSPPPIKRDLVPMFTINTWNDVVSRKDVPVSVMKTKFYLLIQFPQNGSLKPFFDGTENFSSVTPLHGRPRLNTSCLKSYIRLRKLYVR